MTREAELLKRLQALPRQRELKRDLWPGISARLGEMEHEVSPAQSRWRPWAVAAGMVLALTLGYQLGQRQPGGEIADSQALLAAQTDAPSVHLLQGLAREYEGAMRELSADALQAERLIPVHTEQALKSTLEELQSLSERLRELLQDQPDNAYLAAWLVRVEATQFRVLQQVAQDRPRRTI